MIKVKEMGFLLCLGMLVLLFVAGFGTSCTVGTAGRVHKDDEPVKDIEASDVDLRAMAREMAVAIIELDIMSKHKGPVVIAFPTITNRTLTVDFDSNNLQSMIRKQLVAHSKGKVQFLDWQLSDLVYAERDSKRSGQRTSSKRADLPGADYFLKGEAYSMRKVASDGTMSGSHRYSFRLTDAETSIVVWEHDYEFKKSGRPGKRRLRRW